MIRLKLKTCIATVVYNEQNSSFHIKKTRFSGKYGITHTHTHTHTHICVCTNKLINEKIDSQT